MAPSLHRAQPSSPPQSTSVSGGSFNSPLVQLFTVDAGALHDAGGTRVQEKVMIVSGHGWPLSVGGTRTVRYLQRQGVKE